MKLPVVYTIYLRGNSGYLTVIATDHCEQDSAMALINDLDDDGLIEGFDIQPAE